MIVCYLLGKCCLQNMRLFMNIFCQFVYKIRWRKQVVRNKNIHETLGKRHHIIWNLLSIYYFSMLKQLLYNGRMDSAQNFRKYSLRSLISYLTRGSFVICTSMDWIARNIDVFHLWEKLTLNWFYKLN